MIMYTLEPLLTAFYVQVERSAPGLYYIMVFLDFSLFLNFIICFLLGYHVSKTREIVLVPKKILFHYLRTYCFVDLIAAFPSSVLIASVFQMDDKIILMATTAIQSISVLRLKSMLAYLRQITIRLGISDTTHEYISLVIISLFFFHWFACATYLIPSAAYLSTGTIDNSSWTVQANMPPNSTHHALARLYGESFFIALSCFLAAGYGPYVIDSLEEIGLCCFIYIFGMLFMAYLTVVIIELIRSSRASENKYEEIIYQLNMYMRNKELPHDLRRRLLLYYKNRFEMRYFRETAILSTLSEHQRNELFLYSCKELIDSAKLFQGIPRTVVGVVMGALKQEVYLTNDVIVKSGSTGECMFFIDKGTVAEVLTTGKEVRHLEDGEHFGEMPLILPETRGNRIVSYIAAEITECFRLEKKELKHCMLLYDEFAEKLTKQARERYELLLQMEDDEDFVLNRTDVLYDLRSGKILAKPRLRATVEK